MGILGQLVCLFCKSGCRGSAVASALAFHPPDPLYEIRQNKTTGEYSIELFPEIHQFEYPSVQVHRIETKTKSTITLLYFPVPGAHFTLIFSHGNATDCGGMFNHYIVLAETLKMNIIGYDYTGYGPGTDDRQPSERQVYYDIEAVYNWCCVHVTSEPATRVILYGQSVGSGPTCYLASRQPCVGVILHSPILSGVRVLTSSRLLACCDIFPNIDRIKRIHCPVFIIHGIEDNEVGFHHGESLHNAVQPKFRFTPWWVPDRGHNDVLSGNEREYFRSVENDNDPFLLSSSPLLPLFGNSLRRLHEFLVHLQSLSSPSSANSNSERSLLESGSYLTVFVRPFSKPPSRNPSVDCGEHITTY